MTGGSPNLGLNGNDKPKMESVPSLISATAATAEAPKLSFFPSFEVGENVAVPVLQSRPGFVPLPASSRHRESELIPVFFWGQYTMGFPGCWKSISGSWPSVWQYVCSSCPMVKLEAEG